MQKINNYFYMIISVLIGAFLLVLILNPTGSQLNVFFAKTDNFLADFFNVQLYIADWDPYHNTINGLGEKCYLPFTYLFLELFNGFFHYSGATLSDCYASSEAMVSCLFLMGFSALMLYHSLECIGQFPTRLKFVLFFSSLLLFSVERGNLIILCVALICYFIAYRNSEVRWKKYSALTALCVVSVVKIYPAVFGVYLLNEKRFKDILFCFVLTLLLVFLPFLSFEGGFSNISQMMTNLSVFSESYSAYKVFPRFGLAPFFAWGGYLLHLDRSMSDMLLLIPKVIVYSSVIVSLVLFFYEKVQWKKLALVTLPIIFLPTNSGFYCGLYMLPVLLFFLNNNEGRIMDFIYMLLFCVLLNPVQIVIHGMTISWMLSNLAMLFLWLLLIIDSFRSWRLTKNTIQLV